MRIELKPLIDWLWVPFTVHRENAFLFFSHHIIASVPRAMRPFNLYILLTCFITVLLLHGAGGQLCDASKSECTQQDSPHTTGECSMDPIDKHQGTQHVVVQFDDHQDSQSAAVADNRVKMNAGLFRSVEAFLTADPKTDLDVMVLLLDLLEQQSVLANTFIVFLVDIQRSHQEAVHCQAEHDVITYVIAGSATLPSAWGQYLLCVSSLCHALSTMAKSKAVDDQVTKTCNEHIKVCRAVSASTASMTELAAIFSDARYDLEERTTLLSVDLQDALTRRRGYPITFLASRVMQHMDKLRKDIDELDRKVLNNNKRLQQVIGNK